ncbi:hypothetical protein GCM10020367_43750 [Streptomyces sannanensis]|uniref:Uncharacterized protein n=1 Tax=Streptomyces sannanensis TaxID=285536 RepID=A0ABP6SG34_9ACTN
MGEEREAAEPRAVGGGVGRYRAVLGDAHVDVAEDGDKDRRDEKGEFDATPSGEAHIGWGRVRRRCGHVTKRSKQSGFASAYVMLCAGFVRLAGH